MNYDLNVVVTVYNNEKHIGKCLMSIINQWEGDFKLIIAYDEGSSDNTLKICQEMIMGVGFAEIYHREHCFIGEMRNEVAKESEEKYIMFIDGDDELPSDAIKSMLGIAKRTNAECVLGLTELRFPDGKKKISHPIKYSKDGRSWICTTSVHPTLFDRKLFIEKLCFVPDVKTHEDRVNAYLIPKYCKMALVERIMYYYNIHSTSIVRNKHNKIDMFEDIIKVWELLRLERRLFTDEEWGLIEEDMVWSAASCLFFLQYVDKNVRVSHAKWMTSVMTIEFPGWKGNKIILGIRNGNFIVRQYVNMLLNEEFDESFIRFTNGFKMKLIDIGTDVYSLGGWKSWVITKLSKK
jgi:glycosyltransferase involved in cell wall biosynthesis